MLAKVLLGELMDQDAVQVHYHGGIKRPMSAILTEQAWTVIFIMQDTAASGHTALSPYGFPCYSSCSVSNRVLKYSSNSDRWLRIFATPKVCDASSNVSNVSSFLASSITLCSSLSEFL